MNKHEKIKVATDITVKLSEPLFGANFDESPSNRLAACYALTVSELQTAVLTLLAGHAASHSPILVRTMLESLVNLKLLSLNPLYFNQLHYEDADQIIKIYNRFINAFDETDPDVIEMHAGLAEQQRIRRTHFENGVRNQSWEIKFRDAGMADEYGTYGVLCMFTHNSSTNLYARHGIGAQLNFGAEVPTITFDSWLKQSINIFYRCIIELPNFSNATSADISEAIAYAEQRILEI